MQKFTTLFVFIALFVLPCSASAYISAAPDTAKIVVQKPRWDINLRSGLNGSQAAYRNWSQGGTNNVTAIAITVFSGAYTKNVFRYNFNLTLRYGQSRLEDNEFRKSDDIIRLRNQFSRKFDDQRFGTVMNVNFETQFDKGLNSGRDMVVSRFFAPAFLTETVGFSFSPTDSKFEMDAGLALKQTFVRDTSLSTRYGLDEGETFKNEAGFSLIFKYEKELMENVLYTGYLETFSNILKRLDSTDLTFTNEVRGRINSNFSANFEFAVQYNDNVSTEIQVKQIFSLGINYQIL